MNLPTKQLYLFLAACSGNWRSSIYISTEGPGYLLSADRDGRPVVMAVEQFRQLTGEQIVPPECCGQLTREAFESLFAQYLLWQCPTAQTDSLRLLSQRPPL